MYSRSYQVVVTINSGPLLCDPRSSGFTTQSLQILRIFLKSSSVGFVSVMGHKSLTLEQSTRYCHSQHACYINMPLLRPLHHGKDAITDQRPIIARRVHWGNPLFMCTAFSLGVLSALCHHILYAHYDQRIVSSSDGAYQQKLVIRTGTALAFLVKSTLTVAVSIVFVQQFWTSLAGSSERVSAIDSITNVRANILQFLRIRIWMRQRVLALLALILWSVEKSIGRSF